LDEFSQRPQRVLIQVTFAVQNLFKLNTTVIAKSRLLPKCTFPVFFCDKSPSNPNFQKIQHTFVSPLKILLMPLVTCPAIDKELTNSCSLCPAQTFFDFSCNYYLGSPSNLLRIFAKYFA
jgi:hypothetical protein